MHPLGKHCVLISTVQGVALDLSLSFCSLLFLLRVRAVYRGQTIVIVAFCLFWILVSASTCVNMVGNHRVPNVNSDSCGVQGAKKYVVVPFICLCVYDTLVLAAITHKLFKLCGEDVGIIQSVTRWDVFRGKFLPKFLRSLLRDGQIYYW